MSIQKTCYIIISIGLQDVLIQGSKLIFFTTSNLQLVNYFPTSKTELLLAFFNRLFIYFFYRNSRKQASLYIKIYEKSHRVDLCDVFAVQRSIYNIMWFEILKIVSINSKYIFKTFAYFISENLIEKEKCLIIQTAGHLCYLNQTSLRHLAMNNTIQVVFFPILNHYQQLFYFKIGFHILLPRVIK